MTRVFEADRPSNELAPRLPGARPEVLRAGPLRVVLAASLLALLAPCPAAAQARPPVQLSIEGCERVSGGSLNRIVAAELGALLVRSEVQDANATQVRVRCHGGAARLEVDDPITGKQLSRRVELGAVDHRAGPRLLALAIAELVTASWIELTVSPPPRVPSMDATASEATRGAAERAARDRVGEAPPVRRPFRLTGGLSLRVLGKGDLLAGGALQLEVDVLEHFTLAVDARLEQSNVPVSLGEVDVLLGSGALILMGHVGVDAVRLAAAAGFRLGGARLAGRADPDLAVDEGQLEAVWGGPLLGARLGLRPLPWAAVLIEVETGFAAMDVGGLVAGTREIGFDGFWVGGSVSLGVSF